MDYKKIYDELITHRQSSVPSGYTENHHIQMRSCGGSDDKENLVRLTAREHYIAHLLLARFNRCSQTAYALWMMQCRSMDLELRPHIKNSKMYAWARKEFAKYASRNNKITSKGERNSQFGTRWICNIELKENKKISKESEVPEGWVLGRNAWINRFIHKKTCTECDSIFFAKYIEQQMCSRSCSSHKSYFPSDDVKEKLSKIAKGSGYWHGDKNFNSKKNRKIRGY
jgi:hypothetical protein